MAGFSYKKPLLFQALRMLISWCKLVEVPSFDSVNTMKDLYKSESCLIFSSLLKCAQAQT